jgi:hypothetical protein
MAKLKINRGTTYIRSGTFSLDSELQDLTSAVIRFTMKSEEYDSDADDSDAAVKKDVTNGTAEGTYEIQLDPSDTAQLEPGKYYYSIKVDLNGDGTEVYEADEGTITLDGDPTNRLS